MRTDLYTKCMLTLIAAALVIIVLQHANLGNVAHASATGFNSFATVPVNADGSINVKMVDAMDVNIAKVGGSSLYGSLPINIKEFSGNSISSYGLPVNIYAVGGSSVYNAIPVKNSQ